MTARSLRASSEGIKLAKQALTRKRWKHANLMGEVCSSRSTVSNFFNGKVVKSDIFVGLCEKLGLDWQEIADLPKDAVPVPSDQNQKNSIDIAALVQEVREKIKPIIQERCGTMRVLDMAQPIGLNDMYTNVNILEKITGRRRKDISELLQECSFEDVDRFGLGRITEERVPGLVAVKKHTKLMILGKPGAGKTTFLKYLAIQCNQGKFQADRVPIFVTLKEFAEAVNKPGLFEYITHQFAGCGVVETRVIASLQNVIKHSRALIFLDGLDEVREEDNKRVLKEIRDFSDQYRDNHFVMTCRIAAREYTFEKFTEVEVADFDSEQITIFANNWFKTKAVKPETFIKRLEENNRIKQLAASPLLLTLLCLAFEESGDFPANRSELYKEGLDALLKKWDAKRGIQRDQVYKKLSIQRKEDLLSKIALTTFKQGDYFFKQKVAEQYITNYICNLPNTNTDPLTMQLDSEKVLKSIEHQHGLLVERAKGIYSFSHLTFHEYFTAREIVVRTQPLEEALQNLVNYITEKRWREVFLLAVGMLQPSADRLLLLMKQQVDALLANDKKLQQFLIWVNEKSNSIEVCYKPSAVRVLYFGFAFGYSRLDFPTFKLALALDSTLAPPHALALDFALDHDLICSLNARKGSYKNFEYFDPSLALDPELRQLLQQLEEQSPDVYMNTKDWWKAHGQAWIGQLRAVMIKYRNIGHDWQFNDQQQDVLQQYYDANLLLVECLNSDCYVSREVRQEIEDTLLLPITEIEKRKV